MSLFMDLEQSPPSQSIGLADFNQSVEGDFWGAAPADDATRGVAHLDATGQQQYNGGAYQSHQTSHVDEMLFDGGASHSASALHLAAPTFGQKTHGEAFAHQHQQTHHQHHQQQHHAHPPSSAPHAPSTHSSSHHAPPHPPAHLFATPFSPFQHATFEVENDLNGVNPSNLFSGMSGVNAPAPLTRIATGESIQFTQTSMHVGQMAPQPIRSTQYEQVASPVTSPAADAVQSRKRARGPNGAAQSAYATIDQSGDDEVIDLRAEDELRNLDDSTFQVFPSSHAQAGHASVASRRSDSPSMNSEVPGEPSEQKKVKHQLTDRQRRAKIKESMDALKALVPLEPNQKADQATIVASSVALVQNLKDEVAELRKKLQQMELTTAREAHKLDSKRQSMRSASGLAAHPAQMSNSPFTSMMASLNGAGVSMWRMGLSGQIIEVNLVFELVSGFSAAEVIGNTPCGPPLFGSLSIMPSAFLKAFSDVSAVPQLNAAGDPLEHTRGVQDKQQQQQQQQMHTPLTASSSGSSPQLEFPTSPDDYSSASSTTAHTAAGNGSAPVTPVVKTEVTCSVNPSSTAQSTASQASVAPLYANASISNFPVVPQSDLENFFPYRCRSLIHAHMKGANSDVVQPQPHGNFLVNHLAALPYNHVLKLLCRHHTLWGEILESIVTLCLVRDSNGQPDYIMIISTPDCRRLLTPATHTKSTNMPNVAQMSDSMHAADIAELTRPVHAAGM